MATQWKCMIKPSVLLDITALSHKAACQVVEKMRMLTQNPVPDGQVKIQLTHWSGKLYRIRSGDYRIFYDFDQQVVNVYKIVRRNEATYKEEAEVYAPDDLGDMAELAFGDAALAQMVSRSWELNYYTPILSSKPLPESITVELLDQLRVPPQYHRRLLPLKTQDELLSCPGVDDTVLLQIDEYMFERPITQVMQQPDLVLANVDDLLRYKEGDLLTFLLKLSPEQEKYVHWSPQATGPTLVKGGPGTGKSTVALYRIRSLLEQWSKISTEAPRVLFTTYTNALVKSSEQLLEQLLGPGVTSVTVQTADGLAYEILKQHKQIKEIARLEEQNRFLKQAIAEMTFEGNILQQHAQKQTLERMGNDYLLQEMKTVIIARQVNSLAEYQVMPRTGRKFRLSAMQRSVVWKVYERWCDQLQASGKEAWQQLRTRAEALVEQSDLYQRYDAVIIDEAQDLDPSLLRLLIKLCKSPNRIFVTADANQSIYGSGFTWADVHHSLKFQGRTSILRANYRSTREIGEAAQSYLNYGALEPEIVDRQYVNSGPLPVVRAVATSDHEAPLLESFLKSARLSLRLTMGSCAVLCPNGRVGRAIAATLTEMGLEATYMTGRDLNLKRPGIKVMTLNASKGLEFPIVALAGFTAGNYPFISRNASDDEHDEILARERRTMFVGMTRAMRALLVVVPTDARTPLLQGFDPAYWNLDEKK